MTRKPARTCGPHDRYACQRQTVLKCNQMPQAHAVSDRECTAASAAYAAISLASTQSAAFCTQPEACEQVARCFPDQLDTLRVLTEKRELKDIFGQHPTGRARKRRRAGLDTECSCFAVSSGECTIEFLD